MADFDHLLNWTLKRGSHPFPGREGGTCINEAAVVACGYAYRPITCADDMPDSFSRPIGELAMQLNDAALDRTRPLLLPYVTRLECADTPDVEALRRRYIPTQSKRYMTFDEGLRLLDGALAIGRQADAFSGDEVRARLDAARRREPAAAPSAGQGSSAMSKISGVVGLQGELTD